MPTQTIASALLKLYQLGIWNLPTWQDLTGVVLCFDDPASSLLPKGWSAADLANVKSFYDQYQAKATEDAKISFASSNRGTTLPGRKRWQTWVSAMCKSAKIHEKIAACFSSANCHPADIEVESRKNGGPTYIPYCVDDIALQLLGCETLDENGRLLIRYRLPLQAIAQRTWYNLTRRLDRAKGRFDTLEEQVLATFNALNQSKLTRAQIASVIRAVARWRNVAELINTPETMEKVERMEGELERLMQELGAEVTTKTKKKKSTLPPLFKLSNEMIKSLATDDNVQAIMNMYREFFDNPQNSQNDTPIIEYHRNDLDPLEQSVNGGDTGVEYEAGMTPTQLAENLGFIQNIPFLFNNHRRVDGVNPWTSPAAFIENAANIPFLVNLDLHWHQLAGVHAVIRTCFAEKPSPNLCTGVLISDEVGLGKTYQAATVIAFLADAAMRQIATVYVMPPILRERPYLGKEKQIPHLPHLIVVPGTLMSQWIDEIRTLFAPKGIDILTYPMAKDERQFFWGPNGPFASTNHSPSSIIIFVTQSTLQKEYSELYSKKSKLGGADLPWALPELLRSVTAERLSLSLFGQRFLSGIIDEAHTYRNHGLKHTAVLRLLDRCIIRMPLTATPLQTSTKDLAAMGRLAGIPHFFTLEAWNEEKEDARELRLARKELPDDDNPLNDDDSERDVVKLKQVEIARRMHERSKGHVIRRTRDSLNWKGIRLIPLPPLRTEYVYLDLTERELQIITDHGKSLQENVEMGNMSSKLTTRGFYIEYRTSVMFAREDPEEAIPYFDSLEEWEPVKSTKLDTAARLCQYFLQRDGLAVPTFGDGRVDFPALPSVDEEAATNDDKVVVFTEFPSMIGLFINIFKLYGMKVLSINGSMSFDRRTEVLKKFRTQSEYRVLALSSVGTTGINLAFCSLIIFLDQPWSAQDVLQMTGRVHRQPQKKPVLSIHLLGNETADVLVASMAEGKQDMMEAFLSKKAGQELYDLLSGGGGDMDDEDEESISTASAKPRRRKTTASQSTNADADGMPSTETSLSASAHSANPPQSKGKLRPSHRSVSAASQSVSNNSKEKVPKTQVNEKKAKAKADAEARAEVKAAEKVARAEEKARMKVAKATLKGKGQTKGKGNPRFDSPEPSAPSLNTGGVLQQDLSNAQPASNDAMDIDTFPQQTQGVNADEVAVALFQSSRGSQGVDPDADKLPEGSPAAQSKDVDMDARGPSGGVPRPTSPLSPSLSRRSSGDESMRSVGAGGGRPSTPLAPLPDQDHSVLGKRASNVLTPIKSSKAAGRIRPQLNQSDESDGDGRTAIETLPPQPFAALLLQNATLAATQPLAPQASTELAPLALTQPEMCPPPTLPRALPSTQPALRSSFNSFLRPTRPQLPASDSADASLSTQPRPPQPPAEIALPSTPNLPPRQPSGSQISSLPPSRKVPDPQEVLTRLQGRSDNPPAGNAEKGLGAKIPAGGTSSIPYHRQMDDLVPPSPPARLPPPKKANPFAKSSAKPKKG
ncbi:hypothetical protein HYPSUDRAFT_203649 [Hypholoma sublateritium FD-334 SS-4]|uniref:Helicase C-terminal domain-containing protein n=1 Tax=Hypholoma sublateritium (strain FD-334 SS-4) TaxID=945553 RepID=A0A0D2PLB7_HYPSF|nr:hypothetical protein HYPSUDRAFT_203649 [Hypholoma sublateritium FD-334 SS-4]